VISNETKRLGKQPNIETGKPPFQSQVCLELAQMLLTVELASNSLPDLRKWAQEVDLDAGEYNRNGKYAVTGIGPDTWHYICILAGNENSIKPDVHITRFVEGILGYAPSKSEIVQLLQKQLIFMASFQNN